MRTSEYAGKSGIYGLEYLIADLSPAKFERFVENDIMRKEYLKQTYGFIPSLQSEYESLVLNNDFEKSQKKILEGTGIERGLETSVFYFVEFLKFSKILEKAIFDVGENIKTKVQFDIVELTLANIPPLIYIIILLLFIPVCIMFTLNITSGMMKYSRMYNEKGLNSTKTAIFCSRSSFQNYLLLLLLFISKIVRN